MIDETEVCDFCEIPGDAPPIAPNFYMQARGTMLAPTVLALEKTDRKP